MAILKITQSIDNDVYKVTCAIDKTELSDSDKKLIKKYGEPKINVGGSFGSGGDAYTLPDEYVLVVSDFNPYVKEFDSLTTPFDENTTVRVESFRTSLVTKWQGSFTTLRENVDTFSKQILAEI